MIRSALFAALFAFALSSPALAEDKPAGPRGACKDDVEKHCKDVKPGGGRILRCLKEHEADLSAGCKEARTKMREHMKDIHDHCHGDVEKLCHDVKPGKRRVLRCLRRHKDALSEECKTAMQSPGKGAKQEEKHEEKAEEKHE